MKPIRALIADDEAVARDFLRTTLERVGGVEVVAECADGAATVDAIRASRPDVAFLDIQMPGLTGLEVAGSLNGRELTGIVFVTAYDEFAVRAFELHALDYLLKPFDEQRLAEAISRVRQRLDRESGNETAGRLDALLDRLEGMGRPLERVAVKQGNDTVIVTLQRIDWIESEANYARLHEGSRSYLLRATLAALEKRLDPRRFVRIHRGTIVNVEQVERLRSCGRGDCTVTLRDGTELRLSRRFRSRFEQLVPNPG